MRQKNRHPRSQAKRSWVPESSTIMQLNIIGIEDLARNAEQTIQLARKFSSNPRCRNQYYKLSVTSLFFEKICWGMSDCWYWYGARNWAGYGIFGNKKAHRVSWELFFGKIPEKLLVLHRCDLTCCVNPEHLFLGDHRTNAMDCISKGRNPSRKGPRNGNYKHGRMAAV